METCAAMRDGKVIACWLNAPRISGELHSKVTRGSFYGAKRLWSEHSDGTRAESRTDSGSVPSICARITQ